MLKSGGSIFKQLENKLKGDVCTRWGLTVEIIKRIVEQQNAVCAVLGQDSTYLGKILMSYSQVSEALRGFFLIFQRIVCL